MFLLLLALICNLKVEPIGKIDKQWLENKVQVKEKKEYKFIAGQSKVFLDGKETALDKIPKDALITGIELDKDGITILKIDFKSKEPR